MSPLKYVPENHAPQPSISSAVHTYYPGLDTLRAIAIVLVILSHWLPYEHVLNSFFPNGPMGVTLFFVLSGFLITGILVNEKQKLELGKKSMKAIFKGFYLKRSLRIFPIYYLTLVAMLLLQIPEVKAYFWWHFSYASNILFYLKKSFINEYVSPLWSLSVEEQFYLFWPIMILFSNKRWLLFWLCLGVVAGTCSRMLPENMTEKPFSYKQFLMPSCIDCFAIGGLIAYVQRFYPEKLILARKTTITIAFGGLFYLLFAIYMFGENEFFRVVFSRNIFSSFAAAFILYMITQESEKSLLAKTIEYDFFVFIGKISYSMYLWHNLIPYFEFIKPDGQRFFARLAILIFLSTISYYILEKPLLSLKKHTK